MFQRCITILIAAILLSGTTLVSAQNAQGKSPESTFPSEAVDVVSGGVTLTLHVALDEIDVAGTAGASPRTAPFQALGQVRSTTPKTALIRLNAPAASASDLSAMASSAGSNARAVAYFTTYADRDTESHIAVTNRLHVKPSGANSIQALAAQYGFRVIRESFESSGLYEVEASGGDFLASVALSNSLLEAQDADVAEPVLEHTRDLRLIPNDTYFGDLWHLENTGQYPGLVAGNDINVVPAWDTASGAGVNILVVDTGIENSHPDLSANTRTDIDFDYYSNDSDSSSSSFSEAHGTAVSGVAAAVGNNGSGVIGVAFGADIVGVRAIVDVTTDTLEADALNHQVSESAVANQAHISNNSWGPLDSSPTYKVPLPAIVEASIVDGVTNGRNGKGVVYVWAAGNGRENRQNVNMDGYASSRYTIAVAASGGDGTYTSYSEPGASLLVNAPSSFTGLGIVSTVPGGGYTGGFGGTSSAAPTVSGVVALLLEVNPNLGWRDVQHILVQSSTRNNSLDAGWRLNGGGFLFHHDYGYGRVNANSALNLAQSWTPLPGQFPVETISESGISAPIPDADFAGVLRSLLMSTANTMIVEHVELIVNITHPYRGDLSISLVSPSGMRSIFTEVHTDGAANYSNYLFTSMAHFGEDPNGTWTLNVYDGNSADVGQLDSWTLNVYGTVPIEDITPGTEIPAIQVPFFAPDPK